MICVEGTEERTEFDDVEDGIDEFWNTLKSTPEALNDFDVKYKRPMKNKCKGDSGSKCLAYKSRLRLHWRTKK